MKHFILSILVIFICSSAYAQYDRTKVTSQLQSVLDNQSSNEKIRVIISLKDKVNLDILTYELDSKPLSLKEKSRIILDALKQKAIETQARLLNNLSYLKYTGSVESYDSYWIINAISIIADASAIKTLTYRSDIELIEIDNEIIFEEEVSSSPAPDHSASLEAGLKVIQADRLWMLGYTGAGTIVMNIDSGVDGNHSALNYKWRGNSVPWYHAWMDAQGSNFPSWCSSHGSHTMGTMCGRNSSTGDTVGVSPDAEWMAAKRSCSGNYSTFALTVFQWAMDPDSNSATADMPDAINCSWTTTDPGGSQCNGSYRTMLLSLEAVGIAVVWSAGNSGPGASTVTSPKNINANELTAFTTGALDGNNPSFTIASFSSRGPSSCGGSGSLLIKPEVSAPGVNVRSSVPGSSYGLSSGTSMAAPHVAGSVALLKSFAPRLSSMQVLEALYKSATDLGASGEDNIYGNGMINVVSAMIMLGPQVSHTPLPNTTNLNGPYTVSADITSSTISSAPIDTNTVKLFWGRGSITDSVVMHRTAGNTFIADIPGNGSPAQYQYYISVRDTFDVPGHSPGDAPLNIHSFSAGATEITVNSSLIPNEYNLRQNYPNPFNPETNISFDMPARGKVTLKIYNALGKEVAILINSESLSPGVYTYSLNASSFPSGVYFYRLDTEKFSDIKKMILLK